MTCRDAQPGCNGGAWLQAPHRSLDDDLGRAFLYARYNADLSREGLDLMGFKQMQPEDVQKLDSVDHMDDLLAVGSKAGEQVDVAHFGSFA